MNHWKKQKQNSLVSHSKSINTSLDVFSSGGCVRIVSSEKEDGHQIDAATKCSKDHSFKPTYTTSFCITSCRGQSQIITETYVLTGEVDLGKCISRTWIKVIKGDDFSY
jgi:hypothetical protein